MPLKISKLRNQTPRELIDEFRKTIPEDDGYVLSELPDLPQFEGISLAAIRSVMSRERWGISRFVPEIRARATILVNPKTLARNNKATKSKKEVCPSN